MTHRLRPIAAAILFSCLIAVTAIAASSSHLWHPAGYGGGGRFTAVAVDPSNTKNIYIGSDVAGVYRSRDGGNSFELVGKGLGSFAVAAIAVNPAAPHEVTALADDGLYYSTNQGDAWIRISGEISYSSRFFGSRLLLFTRNSLWIGTDKKGVFRLPLNDWKASPQPAPGLERFKVNGLTVFDGFLYAGTSRGVYRLEGKNWQPQMQGFPQGAAEISDIAASRNALYALEKSNGLFRWNQANSTWINRPVSLQPQPKGYKSILVHPHHPDVVFIGSHPENWPHLMYRTQDGGATWKSLQSFNVDPEALANWTSTLSGVEAMTFVPGTSSTIFLTDWWNVWQSSDLGEHWFQKHHGLQNICVNDLKIHPANPAILYLCAADNGLMISENSGKNWRRAMKGVVDGHAREIEISQKNPSRLVLLMNAWHVKGKVHVYESRDSGASWKDIGFDLPVEKLPKLGYVDGLATNLELDHSSEDTIYVGTNGYGVFKTANAGKNWSRMNQGLATPYIKGPGALRVHPRLPNILFAGTHGGIYKSTDSAGSWKRVTKGNQFTFGMAVDPFTPSRIITGAAGNKLLISSDVGQSWQEIRLPVTESAQMAVYSVAFHPQRPGLVLAGTTRYDVRATEGLFFSTDGAKSFRPVPMDIPRINIDVIAWTTGKQASAYIGFMGSGIFRLDLGEKP